MGSEVRSNDGSESVADSGELPTPARHAAPQLVPHLNEHGEEVEALIAGLDTISLKSSITRYREELGRTYHAYGSTEHWGPNDEKAQDQQDLTHHLWTLALKGEYFVAPISDPKWILDLGTGTGIWAIEVAERYPDAEVKGIDVSPIQPLWVPPNLTFEVDDYNREWMDEGVYDLIHARELLGTVPDWVALYRKAYR